MSTKDRAIDAFKAVIESREPVHERIIGQLGNAAGVVEVPSRPNFNYVRLSGATTRTVRAYNLAVAPELDRYVWVEISRVEGEPKYYRVVGYSEYESEGSPADPPVYPGGQSSAEKVVVWTAGTFFTNEKMHNVLSGAELHDPKVPIAAEHIEALEIPTADYDDIQDWINSTQAGGRISGGVLSANGGDSSKLDVTAGTGFTKTVATDIGTTKFFNWSALTAQALTDGQANYIYVNYNVGTQAVTVEVTLDRTTIPTTTAFTLGRVFRDGAALHIVQSGVNVYNAIRFNHERLVAVRGFERATGGVIAEKNQRYLTATAGTFYLGANKLTTAQQDTYGAERFIAWYLLNGVWTATAPQQQVDNLQYNDVSVPGSEALANLTANRYGVFWAFIHMDSDIQLVYGQDDYKLNDAQDAILPGDLPDSVTCFGILAAKIIVQQNSNNLLSVMTAYNTIFPVGTPANHNDLGGLQGGTADEYYHLTATEHGYISGANSQSLLTTASPTFADITISADGVITFGAQVGDKLLLYAGGGYGLGIQAGVLQIITHASNTDIVFGHGTSVAFTEILRIHGEGNITVKNGMWLGTHGAERIVFDATNHYISLMDCDVGIGIAAPETLLHVYGGDSGGTPSPSADMIIEDNGPVLLQFLSVSSSYNDIYFGDADSFQAGWLRYYHAAVNADDLMNFRVNEDIRMTILGSGNVGIGVTDPDELLELYKVGTQLKLSGGAADYATFAVAADGALTITTVDDTAALGHIALMPDGNVGIGTAAPTVKLVVEKATGSITSRLITGSADYVAQEFINSANSVSLYLGADGKFNYYDGADKLTIDTAGNVGINVAAPVGKLHIDQSVGDAVIPVLILDQADISEGFINFIGSDRGVIAGATASVESVRVELGGVVRRLALYADA